jgi:hypothetical protein
MLWMERLDGECISADPDGVSACGLRAIRGSHLTSALLNQQQTTAESGSGALHQRRFCASCIDGEGASEACSGHLVHHQLSMRSSWPVAWRRGCALRALLRREQQYYQAGGHYQRDSHIMQVIFLSSLPH